jgi:hypothetical protein
MSAALVAHQAPQEASPTLPSSPPPGDDPFTGVTIVRGPDGGLTLEARPEAAATLATLFEGFARLLRSA